MIKHRLIPLRLLLLIVVGLAGCGADSDPDEPPLNSEIPLNRVVMEPENYDTISVEGTASPLGALGFIISQQSVSLFVEDGAGVAQGVGDGEKVRITASVEKFSAQKAAEISRKTELNAGDGDAVDERALTDTRIEEGAPYLDLIHLLGSGG